MIKQTDQALKEISVVVLRMKHRAPAGRGSQVASYP